jgi:hypothetical protein
MDRWRSTLPGLVYENGAEDSRGHLEVEEITFGYPLGLVEIVICWRG